MATRPSHDAKALSIKLLEELIERHYAHLWCFVMICENHLTQENNPTSARLRHQKQKMIYRDCLSLIEKDRRPMIAKMWKERAELCYEKADLSGLLKLRQQIESRQLNRHDYHQLLQARNDKIEYEISEMRELARRLKISSLRSKSRKQTNG